MSAPLKRLVQWSLVLVVGLGIWVYASSQAMLTKRYPMPAATITIPSDSRMPTSGPSSRI